MDNKEKLYFEIENSEEFINSKSEDEYDKKVSNYENLLKIRKSVIPIGTMIGVYSLIINYFRIGLLSVFNLVTCIYISYLVKVIINALIDILDRNK